MRDVSSKYHSLRTAKAVASLKVNSSTIEAIKKGAVPKADPLGVAKIAGIQAAKNTSNLIPYCHQVPLDVVNVEIVLNDAEIVVTTDVKAIWKTGVEMEALVSASASALTLYDMLKPIDESMEIVSTKLLKKTGGKSQMNGSGKGLTAAVLVASDSVSKGTAEDLSGKFLVEQLKRHEFEVSRYKVLPDDSSVIEQELKALVDQEHVNLIFTTGGTGIGPRDVTPQATLSIIDRRLDGVEEAFRKFSQDRIPMAMLSRAVAGVRGSTLIINLPGSRGAVEDGIHVLFPTIVHAFRMMKGERH